MIFFSYPSLVPKNKIIEISRQSKELCAKNYQCKYLCEIFNENVRLAIEICTKDVIFSFVINFALCIKKRFIFLKFWCDNNCKHFSFCFQSLNFYFYRDGTEFRRWWYILWVSLSRRFYVSVAKRTCKPKFDSVCLFASKTVYTKYHLEILGLSYFTTYRQIKGIGTSLIESVEFILTIFIPLECVASSKIGASLNAIQYIYIYIYVPFIYEFWELKKRVSIR